MGRPNTAPDPAPRSRADESKPIRADIQALRGVAVLLVLLYHAKLGVRGGYLGVDVFFVISGYLMTQMIVSGIERGNFTFSAFYFRRAKRLLPAAYTTFFVTALLAPQFLAWVSLVQFSKEMFGAVTFTANIVMWRQTGYFAGPAQLMPFLHIWSLSLEEQYYFLLPATLVFVPRRHWMKTAIGLLALSGFAAAIATVKDPALAFYWLPFRAWELGLGSLLSLLVRRDSESLRRFARPLVWPAMLSLVVIALHPISGLHPGPDALIVCLSTLAVIAGNRAELWQNLPARALASVGDFSYSLYLVHWPIFAFAANAWVGSRDGLPLMLRIGGILLSMALGFASYRFVEFPGRRSAIRPSASLMFGVATVSALLVAIPAISARVVEDRVDYRALRDLNFGLGAECNLDDTVFRPQPTCQSGETPTIMVWGDSFGMHLIPGIVATAGGAGVVQVTSSRCGPLLGIAPVSNAAGSQFNHAWGLRCIALTRSVVDYLRSNPSIRVVVLSSSLFQYVEPSAGELLLGDHGPTAPPSVPTAIAALGRTVEAVRAAGKRVILVAPPPSTGANIGLCLERRAQGKLRFGAPEDCSIRVQDYRSARASVLSVIDGTARQFNLPVFRFDPFLCDSTRCVTQIGSAFLYRDQMHFSRAGSRLIGERLSLTDSLVAAAR